MRSHIIRRAVATVAIGSLAALAPLSVAQASEVAPTPEIQETPELTLDDLREIGTVSSVSTGMSDLTRSPSAAVAAKNTTWQRTYSRTWKDAGITLATHRMNISWTGDGNGRLVTSPRSISTDVGTALLVSATNKKSSWDWYTAGKGGTGQGNSYTDIVLGIPTKWGNVGATQSSRIRVQVNGYGGAGAL